MIELKNLDIEELEEVAQISQNNDQYNNYSITIYKDANNNYYVREDDLDQGKDFQLEQDDIAEMLKDTTSYFNQWAREWAYNCDYDTQLELIRWGLEDYDNDEIDEDAGKNYEGECRIIIRGHEYGPCHPTEYLQAHNNRIPDDCNYGVAVFATYQDAKKYLDWLQNDSANNPYGRSTAVLHHNDYAIVAD